VNTTKIEWAEATWNPVTGCTKISPGCEHCYAERMAKRLRGRCGYPADEPFRVTVHPDRLDEPRRWRKPRLIFVCSMGDLFHEDVPLDVIWQVYRVMRDTPRHRYMVLTKRPERMADIVCRRVAWESLLPNVWLAVTVEGPEQLWRVPLLLQCPAEVRFVSHEPALVGPVDWAPWLPDAPGQNKGDIHPCGIDWLISGGESGPGARPTHPDVFRADRDQCTAAEVPFFFKQWGEWRPPLEGESYDTSRGRAGRPPAYIVGRDGTCRCFESDDIDHGTVMLRVGKKSAGRLLDGVEHNGMPVRYVEQGGEGE